MSNAIVQVGPTQNIGEGKDIVRAILGGTLDNSEVKLMRAWAEGLNVAVKNLHKQTGNKVGVLIDLRTMETYTDPEVVSILVKLMKDDNEHIYRTATFGGNVIHEMTEKIITVMAGRDNLKNFKTEEEAVEWLKGNS